VVPPVPLLLPDQPLWELPVPFFLSPQPLLVAQPEITAVDPAIRPAMQSPANTFFSSLLSMDFLLKKKGNRRFFPRDRKTVVLGGSQQAKNKKIK
jgi:hypothetical protein